jgi:hypothetical protein
MKLEESWWYKNVALICEYGTLEGEIREFQDFPLEQPMMMAGIKI